MDKRKCQRLVLTGLSRNEKEILAVEYLLAYGKTLSVSQLQMYALLNRCQVANSLSCRICKEPQTGNPLYMRCLLEELRVFGVFEGVDQLLEGYLRARQAPQLLEKILQRFEQVRPLKDFNCPVPTFG